MLRYLQRKESPQKQPFQECRVLVIIRQYQTALKQISQASVKSEAKYCTSQKMQKHVKIRVLSKTT